MAGIPTRSPRLIRSELEKIIPAAPATEADSICGRVPQLIVEPESDVQVAAVLRWANENVVAVAPRGGGSKSAWGAVPRALDLVLSTRKMNRVIEHAWGDMTATVEPGCTFCNFQAKLAEHGQRLALDPLFPERATLGGIIATNDSGSLRVRFGSLRDLIIGVTLALPDGTLARSGGKVVKNVAGYDLPKLATGSLGTLGVITQAIFRLHPLPQTEQTLSFEFESPAAANKAVLALLDSVLTFTGVQLRFSGGPVCMLDVRFEGVPNAVEEQANRAERVVGNDGGEPQGMSDSDIWRAPSQLWDDSPRCICKVSVLPTEIAAVIDHASSLADASGVRVRAVVQAVGVGLLRLDGSTEALLSIINSLRELIAPRHGSLVLLHADDEVRGQVDIWGSVGTALGIMQSMKRQFDDKAILNPGRFAGGI